MAFSQSFLIGDSTLNQLDNYEMEKIIDNNNKRNPKNLIFDRATSSKNIPITNANVNISPEMNNNMEESKMTRPLDVIDESPTDKSHVLGKSIKEQLKKVSSRKKSGRHLRRSRSDPLTKIETSDSKSAQNEFDDIDSMFDSSWSIHSKVEKSKAQRRLSDKCEWDDDGFDNCLKDIQTQLNSPKTPISQRSRVVRPLQKSLQTDNLEANMFESNFSLEMEGFEFSKIDVEKQLDNNIGGHKKGHNDSIALFSGDDDWTPMAIKNQNFTQKEKDQCDQSEDAVNEIQWEDSAFFNSFRETQLNDVVETSCKEKKEASIAVDALLDLDSSIFNADLDEEKNEMESRLLDVSLELSKMNESLVKISQSLKRCNSPMNISLSSQHNSKRTKLTDALMENEIESNKVVNTSILDVNNLTTFGCSKIIIKEYLKKGINRIFEWQADCLRNSNVSTKYFAVIILKHIYVINN